MTKPKVQKGTPRPKAHRERKYPFYEMQPGEMFFQPGAKPNTMMSLASATGKRMTNGGPEVKFSTRQLWMKKSRETGAWIEVPSDTSQAYLGVAVYRMT